MKFPFDTEDKNLHDNEGNIDLEKVLPILRQVKASRSQRFDLKYNPKDKDFDAKIRRGFKQYYANPWKLPEPDYCGGVMLAPDGEYYEIPKVTVRYIPCDYYNADYDNESMKKLLSNININK